MNRTLPVVALMALAACQAPSGACKLSVLASVPFHVADGHLIVDAELNGQPSKLIFDTGAHTSVLTNDAVQRLGLRTESEHVGTVNGIGGMQLVSLVDAETFSIRNLKAHDFHFIAGNVLRQAHAADGLLSTDFLSRYDVDLDVPGRRIDFFASSGNCDHPTVALTGDVFATRLISDDDDPRPRIRISIDGKMFTALLDTGSPVTVMFRSAADRLGLGIAALKADRVGKIGGIGPDPVVAYRHVLQTVKIGDITVENMPIDIADQPPLRDEAMILGLNFIGRIHLWISNSSGRLIMQYPPLTSPLDEPAH